jgi:hypothetical protein
MPGAVLDQRQNGSAALPFLTEAPSFNATSTARETPVGAEEAAPHHSQVTCARQNRTPRSSRSSVPKMAHDGWACTPDDVGVSLVMNTREIDSAIIHASPAQERLRESSILDGNPARAAGSAPHHL